MIPPETWDVVEGDCLLVMSQLPEASVDAVVTDPPYGLGFMGKEWDQFESRNLTQAELERRGSRRGIDHTKGRLRSPSMHAGEYDYRRNAGFQGWCEEWARECLRVLKPGGHLVAFGGTRTFHRLATGIEEAGFEIRDMVAWLFGEGFPKSRNLGDGVGTGLKPGHEPVVLARKSISERSVTENVKRWRTGGLNIETSRLAFRGEADEREAKEKNRHADFGSGPRENRVFGEDAKARRDDGNYDPPGRWPPNVAVDEEAAAMVDEQSGERSPPGGPGRQEAYPAGMFGGTRQGPLYLGESGGASRFFYCPKADRAERQGVPGYGPGSNLHPTVKPVALMAWLCRLVTPPKGLILDPFAGSGSTGIAALRKGFRFLGIEKEPDYVEIARARIEGDAPLLNAR